MPIEGMINSDKHIDVIERKVIPDMRRAFPGSGGIFPKATCSVYFIEKSEDDFRKHNLNALDWPGNSPDHNPIETF